MHLTIETAPHLTVVSGEAKGKERPNPFGTGLESFPILTAEPRIVLGEQ